MITTENYTLPGSKGRIMSMDLTYDDANRYAPLVIFVHGFKGFKDWGTHHLVANYFAAQGFRFLKFNFSHNGTTPEQPTDFADLIAFSENTFSIELEDLQYVIDWVCSGSVIPVVHSVALIGHSMGGGISVIKAAEDKRVSHLITMASVASFRNLWPPLAETQWRLSGVIHFPNYRTGQQMPVKSTLLDDLDRNPGRLNVLANAANVTQPWLLIHGTADSVVTLSHAHELKAMQPNAQLLILPNADHVFGAGHPYLQSELPTHLHQLCEKAIAFLKQ
ncbi:alpha/beta hydrolase family protein [Mucilaginibacter aquatilis]|uniref:Alpha/beta fold hydrolase n=1 Tax=Mucilaginibacter aquatilis TaxID=1517760 RepID=A0A6I4I4T6_9SPHI|nr:alpha/beta fold hydrolase [Mucilaginibacter aquatilis]MVN90175.1 alpha/beta fold hydrolase [Mucilaginibacter aquatilis]